MVLRKTIWKSEYKYKTTQLNKNNWIKVAQGNNYNLYIHHKRKNLLLNYNTKTKTGYFKDTKKQKILSEIKKIEWK